MKKTATLLLNCPDQKGIVASISNFLYRHNANILHADEHQDNEQKLFFLRTQWDMEEFTLNQEEFNKEFSRLAGKFQMDWRVSYSENVTKIAIFVSRQDHCLADLLYRHKNNELNGEIKLVISNHSDAKPLSLFYGIPFYDIKVSKEDKPRAEKESRALLKEYNIDLVVLARYMQILSGQFIKDFANPIINIHHSFLPAFIGAKPYHQAHAKGVKVIGATAHYVTDQLDQGPIIEQDVLRISHRDNVEDLIQKGRDLEKNVLSRAVKWHLQNRILIYNNKSVVFD